MVKVKICGITNLEDALAAYFYGADALGFIFYKKSPRYISPLKASKIIRILPKKIYKVGVFVDADIRDIKKIAKLCNLDMVQLHGGESPEYCDRLSGVRVIKAFRVEKDFDFKKVALYKVYARLFDTFSKGLAGGTGVKFNWNLLKNMDKISKPVFLSGGLNSLNVKTAIKKVRPEWVDLCSSLELRPGKKNHKMLKRFMRIAKDKI
jgi:phosphoribosylanthranilate isomerase